MMNPARPRILLTAFLLTVATLTFGATEAWQLAPVAAVDGSGVFLSELLKNPAPTVPLLRLAPAPPWGQTNLLTREQIIELGRRDYPALDTTNWSGPAEVRIARRSRQWLDFQVLEMLTAALQREYAKDNGELEARFERPWTPVNVPDEELTLKLTELPSDGLLPNSLIGFDLFSGKECVGSWRVGIQAKLWREAPVARSPLLRGQLLREADIGMERRDMLLRHEAFVNMAAADPSTELRENVPAGLVVLQHCVRLRPIIRRGQVVDAVYAEGSMRIALKVETLEEGAAGQIVRVRNPRTHHDFYGKIENEDTILITL